jgi:hypothetical protein
VSDAKPKTKVALDFATRSLVAETVREAVQAELAHARFTVQSEPAAQLHGPSSYACEAFVLGAVLAGAVPISTVPLQRSDFWAQLTGRVWEAMQQVFDPRLIPVVVDNAIQRGTLAGDPEHFELILDQWAGIAAHQFPSRDIAAAVMLLREHARSRRLVHELARLADGICAGNECFDSARDALRELFVAESPKRPSKPPELPTPPPASGSARRALKPL